MGWHWCCKGRKGERYRMEVKGGVPPDVTEGSLDPMIRVGI